MSFNVFCHLSAQMWPRAGLRFLTLTRTHTSLKWDSNVGWPAQQDKHETNLSNANRWRQNKTNTRWQTRD